MPVGAIAGCGLAVGVGSSVAQMSAASKQAKAAKEANRYQRQMNNLQSARQKLEAIRAGRQAQAQAAQAAENQGAASTSVGEGGVASIQSQTSGNVSFLDKYNFMADQASRYLQKSADYAAKGQMWAGIGEIAGKVYAATGGIQFKGPKPPAKPAS